jgi:F0F1-type ATP synthase membrane subunit b/b'
MSVKRKIFLAIFFLLAIGLAAAGGEAEHHFNWGAFFGSVLNSTLLFGALIFFMRKPVIKLLTQKTLDIKNDIIEREKNLKITSEEFQKISRRLDQIENEVKSIQQAAREQGDVEKDKIEELGKRESGRIIALSETEIKNRVESSVNQLKARIARLTIDHFREDIRDRLDEQKHREIIDRNIDLVGKTMQDSEASKSDKS